MGALVSQSVHYRTGDACHVLLVTADNPPTYDIVDGVQVDNGLPDPTIVNRAGVAQDTSNSDTGAADGTTGTWHYPYSCPEQ